MIKSAKEALEDYLDYDDNDGHSYVHPDKAIIFAKCYAQQYLRLAAERAKVAFEYGQYQEYIDENSILNIIKELK